uniref:Immunoglobulin I-set domain-containing protein n=1 Tax=Hucho hucho TaxID=62062 RepID=A0A4W5MPW0_9TELE
MPHDSGEWTVVAQNRAGKSSVSITLTVDAKENLVRPQFIEKLKNVSVKKGTLVELAVKAIGNPLPDIVWLKNSDIISPQKHPNIKYVFFPTCYLNVHMPMIYIMCTKYLSSPYDMYIVTIFILQGCADLLTMMSVVGLMASRDKPNFRSHNL